MSSVKKTPLAGNHIIAEWMNKNNIRPFSYQQDTWQKYSQGYSGLVVAPTGFGKTFSVFLAVIIDYLNQPEKYKPGLKILWITPLRSLSKDICRAMQEALNDIGLDWVAGVRNGDVPAAERKRQTKRMPEVLVVTPESLHLLFTHKKNNEYFKNIACIVADEWHDLLGSKRGVLLELAVMYLQSIQPKVQVWGLTATIGNVSEALEVLCGFKKKKILIKAKEKKKIDIITVYPDQVELLPWAGHLGAAMTGKVVDIILKNNTTLIFTNTRNQSEQWYQNILAACEDLAGQIAIHHGSIDLEMRHWIEEQLGSGTLKAVVCTSSLDLGVDFKPVDAVIQIGSSKGVARFLQRAGRSGHTPFATSVIYFVPTHTLELLEAAALRDAYKQNDIESRSPYVMCMDVLAQFMVTLAVGDGFYAEPLLQQLNKCSAFQFLSKAEFQWILQFITKGGSSLQHYEEYHKVVVQQNGLHQVESRRIAMLHRLNMGVIVSDAMMKVKFISGGYIGMVEEYFITRMKPHDHFILAGRTLELLKIKESEVLVRSGTSKKAVAPSWLGGRLPLSPNLSDQLRKKLGAFKNARSGELKFLKPVFDHLTAISYVPGDHEFLVEIVENKYGQHFFFFPFEGKLIHEVMAVLIAYRISLLMPVSFTIASNDYGFELLTDQRTDVQDETIHSILKAENLLRDITASINASDMARRKFRDIACIAGLVLQNHYAMKKTFRNIQGSSNLIFNVYEQYEPDNLLYRQAFDEVFQYQLDEARLLKVFERIAQCNIVIKRTTRFTPLSFPLKIDSMRESLSSEDLATRIERIQKYNQRL
jgi:ATP-dependent Lhr-like helicase